MIKANTTIIAGEKTFKAGQTVTGLSSIDKEWMKKAGYITESADKKKAPVEAPAKEEGLVDGEL